MVNCYNEHILYNAFTYCGSKSMGAVVNYICFTLVILDPMLALRCVSVAYSNQGVQEHKVLFLTGNSSR